MASAATEFAIRMDVTLYVNELVLGFLFRQTASKRPFMRCEHSLLAVCRATLYVVLHRENTGFPPQQKS
jgi:hypothetical protein